MGFLRFIVLAALIFVLGKYAVVSAIDWYDGQSRNPTAVATGFADYKEQDQAKAAGFSEPAAFRAALTWAEQARKETEIKKEGERIAAAAALAELNRNPAERMDIDTVAWRRDGFGTVGIATLTVTNSNEFSIKDIALKCSFYAKSGTEVSTAKHTIYDTMKAKSKKTFKEVNIGFIHSQAARGGCSLVAASRL